MAKKQAVWGIDIGQCALKALRCTLDDEGEVVADAFDFIEYPKILTQPDADPEALVKEALQQFLSRNVVKGDKVAIAAGGQSGLSRFIKLPPVQSKKVPDLVKYEAKQQIPFDLEEVVWDFQVLPGAIEEEGFALEAEVGLFAMKREQVFKAIASYLQAEIELDIVQLTPLCLFNFATYDFLPEVDVFDPDDQPDSVVLLSMGTETTDLVITNGYRVWQRSIPLGGNHFTKQLSKELKLTFANAEHLKRNFAEAEDKQAVVRAMGRVFGDLITEVTRSISFFRNNEREAKITAIHLLGSAAKLPGLSDYVQAKLDMPVHAVDKFKRLQGEEITSSQAFQENALTFGVCYGLALQGLGKGRLSTNLVPRELLITRMIRAKKPWALVSVGALLLALSVNFVYRYSHYAVVTPDRQVNGVDWAAAEAAIKTVSDKSSSYQTADAASVAQMSLARALGEEVMGNSDGRLLWMELLRAINAALPRDPELQPGEVPNPLEKPFFLQPQLHIEYVETQFYPDLSTWFTASVRNAYITGKVPDAKKPEADAEEPASAEAAEETVAEEEESNTIKIDLGGDSGETSGDGPSGPGWVIELKGYHYFNANRAEEGGTHVRKTLLKNLEDGFVMLPGGPGQPLVRFTMKELGIQYPTLVKDSPLNRDYRVPNPNATPVAGGAGAAGNFGGAAGNFGGAAGNFGGAEGSFGAVGGGAPQPAKPDENPDATDEPVDFPAPRYEFVVQFCWQETRLSVRLKRKQAELEEKLAAQEAGAGGASVDEEAETEEADTPDGAAQNGGN